MFPAELREEIQRLLQMGKGGGAALSEIRLRADGVSFLLFGGEACRLRFRLSGRELAEVLNRICGGSLYAYRDSIAEGFVGMAGGIRVGVFGHARYENSKIVGISEISGLIFRFPVQKCDCISELLAAWSAAEGGGLLIFSPPGTGKTTALRSLTQAIGSGKEAKRICVVDERCEFMPSDYADTAVDILRGYRRADGIEIATRTLNPEIIAVDEIGNPEEARRIVGVLGSGVPLIATAHAASTGELLSRSCLRDFFEAGIFRVYAGIYRRAGKYSCLFEKAEAKVCEPFA